MKQSRTQKVREFGQSLWYDNISRAIIRRGELAAMIREDGIAGVTSNPTIFMKAIAEGADYDDDIRAARRGGETASQIVQRLMVGDIREAADVLRPVFDAGGGLDGFVSLECNPHLAYDTAGTVAEAGRLYDEVGRPNLMIKVPGTPQGVLAAAALLRLGINVNVTLLFSPEQYRRVAEAYIEALEARLKDGLDIAGIRSVASFFLSRIDTVADKKLDQIAASLPAEDRSAAMELRGQAAIAVAKVTYGIFRRLFDSPRFKDLAAKGAVIQRPLWASTGTKDPAYSDVKYVEGLIGRDTVNTLPQATLEAFRGHGRAAATIDVGGEEAPLVLSAMEGLGIVLDLIYDKLQADGVQAFIDSWESLLAAVAAKMERP